MTLLAMVWALVEIVAFATPFCPASVAYSALLSSARAIRCLASSRAELRAALGAPHYVEADRHRTCGGEEDWWAFALPSGHRVGVWVDATAGGAALCADPPDLAPALELLRIAADDPRLHRSPMPVRLV